MKGGKCSENYSLVFFLGTPRLRASPSSWAQAHRGVISNLLCEPASLSPQGTLLLSLPAECLAGTQASHQAASCAHSNHQKVEIIKMSLEFGAERQLQPHGLTLLWVHPSPPCCQATGCVTSVSLSCYKAFFHSVPSTVMEDLKIQ